MVKTQECTHCSKRLSCPAGKLAIQRNGIYTNVSLPKNACNNFEWK